VTVLLPEPFECHTFNVNGREVSSLSEYLYINASILVYGLNPSEFDDLNIFSLFQAYLSKSGGILNFNFCPNSEYLSLT